MGAKQTRGASRVVFVALGVLATVATMGGVGAQAKRTASFNVNAIHTGPGMEVTITSKVWISPTQARAEVAHPLDGDMVFLVSQGSMYQLQPKSKRGIKSQLPPEVRKQSDIFDMLLSQFAFDARGVLKSAKKIRTETVSGYACDVFTQTITEGPVTRSVTVWMPQKMSPQFPIKAVKEDRTVINKPGAKIDQRTGQAITLSNIKLNGPVEAERFKVPTGYKIESGNPQPPAGRK